MIADFFIIWRDGLPEVRDQFRGGAGAVGELQLLKLPQLQQVRQPRRGQLRAPCR